MTTAPTELPRTLLASLVEALRRTGRNGGDAAPPAAVLWTDVDGQWKPIIGMLQGSLPGLFVLGDSHDPAARSGPVIWLKCIVERALPEVSPPDGEVPILYLPNVDRQLLRAAEDCLPALQPLVELQYRGKVWHQRSGRDWTVEAFLSSEDGLGLDVAQDQQTRQALVRCLRVLADADLALLRGHRLEASDFDNLAVEDPVRSLLRWMSDPSGERKGMPAPTWASLRSMCGSRFKFDPEADGVIEAGARLGRGEKAWSEVWQRFCEAPDAYRGIVDLLRRAKPIGELSFDRSRWPDENEKAEKGLRQALAPIAEMPQQAACDRVKTLEAEHGQRRSWVWSRLGESPLAAALEHLAVLADRVRTPLGGADADAVARAQAESGWIADAAVMGALAAAPLDGDRVLVGGVVRAVYGPWLDESARHLQKVIGEHCPKSAPVVAEKGVCVLFADGLRLDVGRQLAARLGQKSLRVRFGHRWAGAPTVTATAKPAVAPIADKLGGGDLPEDFSARVTATGLPATAARLREMMTASGTDVLDGVEAGNPAAAGGGWTEAGSIDHSGHELPKGLPGFIDDEVERLADRIRGLLQAGWKAVRVVTDHGWVYLPGGLPKVDLPAHLTQSKWGRCATIRGNSTISVPTAAWHWNASARFATGPGVSCFIAGKEYEHGGISPQECVIPDILVEQSGGGGAAKIESVKWQGLRCRVAVQGAAAGVRVDIRLKPAAPETSIVPEAKEIAFDGTTSLVIPEDKHEGSVAAVVVVDREGNILDRRPTTVGENS
jgi:hypothetical protein